MIKFTALGANPTWQRAVRYGQMSDAQRVKARLPRPEGRYATAWLRIRDQADGTPARLDLYGDIGWSYGAEGITAAAFSAQLNAIQSPSVELHINSPGGDVFDGIAILNMLRSHPKPINVVIDGMAASAASFIAMAGETVTMMPNSQMMIHDAIAVCAGNAAEMTEMAGLLDKASDNIAQVYAMRSGRLAGSWRSAMRAETWYSAEQAVAAGLADRVGELRRGQKLDSAQLAAQACVQLRAAFSTVRTGYR